MLPESLYIFLLLLLALIVTLTSNIYLFVILLVLFLPLLTTLLSITGAPFVPSNKKKLETMLKLAELKQGQTVYDLGAGDGRIIIEASKQGCDSFGYEVSFPLVVIFYLQRFFRKTKAKMYWGDFWKKDYSDADVIFVYLLVRTMKRFEKEIYPNLKQGTKIISNTFDMPNIKPVKSENGVYLYIKN